MSELEEIRKRKLEGLKKNIVRVKNPSIGPVHVTDATFDSFVRENSICVVDFWAEWCYPCRMLSPIIDEIAKEYAGKASFGKLNVDENPETPKRFGISGIPTLLIFKDGQLTGKIVGAVPKQRIEAELHKLAGI
jgi:thioredoxin 1